MNLRSFVRRFRLFLGAAALSGTAAGLLLAQGSGAAPTTQPPAAPTADLVDTAVANGSFRTLATALQAAGLVDALKSPGPFTVFAPTDEAFARLPAGTVQNLLRPENRAQLVRLLQYHVLPTRVASRDLVQQDEAATLAGPTVAVSFRDGRLRLNDATVRTSDVAATNGIIHIIDRVLLPPGTAATAPAPTAREVILLAIEKGVPTYNSGNHAGCADIYEVTCLALLAMPDDRVSPGIKAVLRGTMSDLRPHGDASERAWALRRALDRALASMEAARP